MEYKVVWQDVAVANLQAIREGIEEVSRSADIANTILGTIYRVIEETKTVRILNILRSCWADTTAKVCAGCCNWQFAFLK